MKVTIACPVYGVEKYVERCVRSLMEQTYEDIEYIFVNDCTKDHSWEILQSTISCYSKRIKQVRLLTHDFNRGIAASRNTAIDSAIGDFIIFVDSDDYVEKNIIEEFVKKQQENDADFITCEYIQHTQSKNIKRQFEDFDNPKTFIEYITNAVGRNNIWARFIRTSLFRDYKIRCKEGINVGEDLQCLIPLVYHAQKYATIHLPLYHYDCSNESSYTHGVSIIKAQQSLTSVELAFCSINNDPKYKDAFTRKRLFIIANQIANTCKMGGNKEYYYFLKNELSKIGRRKWDVIGWQQLLFYFPNYWFAKTITKVLHILKDILV